MNNNGLYREVPNKEIVSSLRTEYPKGTRVRLVSMQDPYSPQLKR